MLPWKKTFRKLPAEIEAALAKFPPQTNCLVGCAKTLTKVEVSADAYRHLCVDALDDLRPEFESFVPSPNVGPASYANATPREIPDRSRVKYSKLIHGRAPTRGRFSFHPTAYRRDVWHQNFFAPAMLHIAFKCVDHEPIGDGVRVHFQIQEIINTSDPNCRPTMLRCVNLLQENVGKIGLFTADNAEVESIRRLSEDFGWRILPESERTSVMDRMIRRLGVEHRERARQIQDRFDLILSLNPRKILHSTRGFVGYFVFEFADNLTVFENLEIDHAMYVIHSGAQEFSRLTRSELRRRLGPDVERIIHTKNWQQRLATVVKKARGDQSPAPNEMI